MSDKEQAAAESGAGSEGPAVPKAKDHNKYRKPKPWDHDGIEHWKIEVRHPAAFWWITASAA